ncbi:MAG: NAD-binding protein [Candidatus Marinimicrobia bacterium]|nr:NAD-binding protein [Candidatus Neomarinimicrobiota bacterium]MBL7009908.1 NAD-binding protein [Candidatus Neomarinimicrobiota bacterium]MBL7030141.1 NAD-binding protein [Candidatus Neomarinimicrobiota bacterium]
MIRNSFFQVGAGILITMMIGGFVLQWLEPGEISKDNNPFWWAIVTMTTVGYGDFSPETPGGRIFAVLIMFIGISLVSLLTATISSIFVAQKIREGKGLENLNLTDHLILCGWNPNGERVLNSIQLLGRGEKNDLVLINELNEEEISKLKNRYNDLNIHFVAGDFTQEEILKKASINDADTVIVIPNTTGSEVATYDEKTIFATLTIKSIDPGIRVVAVLLDRENLTHIKRANADEVVVGDDFSAHIIASHVMDPGIPQIANQLMDSNSTSRFKRVAIPSEYVGKPYDDLFNYFRQKDGSVLIGVFSEDENLGIGAILSSDASALDAFIEKKLKEGGISLNEESKINVVINPANGYILNEGERAIIIP